MVASMKIKLNKPCYICQFCCYYDDGVESYCSLFDIAHNGERARVEGCNANLIVSVE
jgi:hypothetical protein